jgi:hypothetical protein
MQRASVLTVSTSRASFVTAVIATLTFTAGCGAASVSDATTLAPAPSTADVTFPASEAPPAVQGLPAGRLIPGVDAQLLRETLGLWVYGSELMFETADAVGIFDTEAERVVASFPLPDVAQINGLLLTRDSLWVLDHDRGRVIRMDRSTGEELAAIDVGGRAVSLTPSPEGIWAGSAHVMPESVALIDPATNRILRRLEVGAFPSYGAGGLWFGRDEAGQDGTVRELHPTSGELVSSIELGDAEGCYLGGSFPDVVWSWCFEPPPLNTEATRLDLAGSSVSATVPLGAPGGLVGVHEDASWFVAEPPDGSLRLLKVENATNLVEATFGLEGGTLMAMHDGALFLIDREAGTLTRLVLVDVQSRADADDD